LKTVGYHGTKLTNANKILLEQRFIDSKRNIDWLGTGVYFFSYKNHADWWVRAPRYKGQETQILVADLEYTEEQLLDLDDPSQLQEMESIVKEIVHMDKSFTKSANISKAHMYEQYCWACNLIKSYVPEIGIIIYTFPQGRVCQYVGFKQNQRQICVSDHSIIGKIKKATGENHVRQKNDIRTHSCDDARGTETNYAKSPG